MQTQIDQVEYKKIMNNINFLLDKSDIKQDIQVQKEQDELVQKEQDIQVQDTLTQKEQDKNNFINKINNIDRDKNINRIIYDHNEDFNPIDQTNIINLLIKTFPNIVNEHMELEKMFDEIKKKIGYKVLKIESIYNGRHTVIHEARKYISCLKDSDVKFVFHGTSKENTEKICKEGFSTKITKRSLFGIGPYTTTSFNLALSYAIPNKDNEQIVIIADLLQGPTAIGTKDQSEFGYDTNGNEILTLTNGNDIFCSKFIDQINCKFTMTLLCLHLDVNNEYNLKDTRIHLNYILKYNPDIWNKIKNNKIINAWEITRQVHLCIKNHPLINADIKKKIIFFVSQLLSSTDGNQSNIIRNALLNATKEQPIMIRNIVLSVLAKYITQVPSISGIASVQSQPNTQLVPVSNGGIASVQSQPNTQLVPVSNGGIASVQSQPNTQLVPVSNTVLSPLANYIAGIVTNNNDSNYRVAKVPVADGIKIASVNTITIGRYVKTTKVLNYYNNLKINDNVIINDTTVAYSFAKGFRGKIVYITQVHNNTLVYIIVENEAIRKGVIIQNNREKKSEKFPYTEKQEESWLAVNARFVTLDNSESDSNSVSNTNDTNSSGSSKRKNNDETLVESKKPKN